MGSLAKKSAIRELARRGLAPTTPITASGRSLSISTSPFSDPISTGPKMDIDPSLASATASAVQLNLAGQRAKNMFKNTPTSSAGPISDMIARDPGGVSPSAGVPQKIHNAMVNAIALLKLLHLA